jgi:alkylation response protein AidB-like acyl-CoA dehydrogenase
MLDLARTHALERVQFGVRCAVQAVRHRLADALVAVEALDAALTAARETRPRRRRSRRPSRGAAPR